MSLSLEISRRTLAKRSYQWVSIIDLTYEPIRSHFPITRMLPTAPVPTL